MSTTGSGAVLALREPIAQVDFEEHTIYYCPVCQTDGRVLKDGGSRGCCGEDRAGLGASEELVEAIERLLPQLTRLGRHRRSPSSRRRSPPDRARRPRRGGRPMSAR